jgi:hypothetical protein
MRAKLFFLISMLSYSSLYSQDLKDIIFSTNTPDFKFQILYEREGEKDTYSKKEFNKLDRNVPGQFSLKANKSHILKIFFNDGTYILTINSLEVAKPTIAKDGQVFKSIRTDNCINESTGDNTAFLLFNLSKQDYVNLILLNSKTNYVHEYLISIESIGAISTETKEISIEREVDVHIFRDIGQMDFDEEKKMWGEVDRSGVSIEVKNLSVDGIPKLTNIYQIRKFVQAKTTPLFTMVFKYQKQDNSGNYIYYCIAGNSQSTGEFSESTKASITLQCSEKLSEMAKGKSGNLTTIVLDGGIFCYICED